MLHKVNNKAINVVLESTTHLHAYIAGKIDHNLSTWEKLPVVEEITKQKIATILQARNVL
jgi:chorismate mutase